MPREQDFDRLGELAIHLRCKADRAADREISCCIFGHTRSSPVYGICGLRMTWKGSRCSSSTIAISIVV
jgi:hypothetical protein